MTISHGLSQPVNRVSSTTGWFNTTWLFFTRFQLLEQNRTRLLERAIIPAHVYNFLWNYKLEMYDEYSLSIFRYFGTWLKNLYFASKNSLWRRYIQICFVMFREFFWGCHLMQSGSPKCWLLRVSMREKCPYREFLWSECRKIRTRKTPNTNTFHAVYFKETFF